MKNLLFTLSLLFLISCGKEDNNNTNLPDCDFIGKWCQPSPFDPNVCYELLPFNIEFRANGELLLLNTTTQRWESSDCKIINVINIGTGIKAAEYKIIKIGANTMTIDIGTTMDLIRSN
ncbi:MAG: hypothetical protein IPN29_15955 [Saprospiraceae bacterium]|nr:hypothetical protein [Saprospiraceae bacterium]